ncbi:MAG: phage portal protein [Anaerolineae bacterium]
MAHRTVITNLDVLRPLMQRGLSLPARMSWESFVAHEEIRAAKVREYRDYNDGEHDVELSPEMKEMLRSDGLNLNHCENILETLSDRLRLSRVQATVIDETGEPDLVASSNANEWINRLTRQWNALDGLQIDLHDAIPRDGISYVMAQYDSDAQAVKWTHEEAFDGHEGVIVLWGNDSSKPTMALKIWHETQRNGKHLLDNVMYTVYFPDRIEKYVSTGGNLQPRLDDRGEHVYPWIMMDGSPIGVAVVPFVYKGRRYNRHGLGRLEQVIPIQRAVNRTFTSTIMTSEHIGFPIRYALGMEVPATIKPGTWLNVKVPSTTAGPNGSSRPTTAEERVKILDAITKIKIGQIESARLEGLLSEIQQFIAQMYIVSGTPYPEGAGANISGEALKQLDIRLVGTAGRCQTSWGNSYEQLIKLSARIESVFGGNTVWSDDTVLLDAQWESAEVRDDATVISNAKEATEIIPELDLRTRLELIAEVYGWDDMRLDAIEERIRDAQAETVDRELGMLLGNGGFGAFGEGVALDDPLNPPNTQDEITVTPIIDQQN